MNALTQTDRTTLHDSLTRRLAELRAEIDAARQARDPAEAATATDVADQRDGGQRQQLAVVDDVQEDRDLDEIAQVELALTRLDEGTYGNCLDCDEPIALARLRVQPAAQRCADCQATLELRLAHPR